MVYTIDPQILLGLAHLSKAPPPPVGDVESRRARLAILLGGSDNVRPKFDDVLTTDFHTTTADGHKLLLRWYTKKDLTLNKSPAVVYFHGGGMITGSLESHETVLQSYVSKTSVAFLAVDYRLAPEVHHPTPVEDCYAGLVWLHNQAKELGIDASRIAVMGDSAGGGLAACTALLARKRNTPPVAKQILIYPMLDDRNTKIDERIDGLAVWKCVDNITGWQALLGDLYGTDDVSETAAGARMKDAVGMPPLYLDTGELDIFRDEDVEYALKHMKAGVRAELHVHPAVPHSFEVFAPEADVSKRALADRMRAVSSL